MTQWHILSPGNEKRNTNSEGFLSWPLLEHDFYCLILPSYVSKVPSDVGPSVTLTGGQFLHIAPLNVP